MREREAATRQPRCPNNCTAGVRPVISDDPTVDRYQCGNLDCMRNFSTPKPGYGSLPLLRDQGEEEANVAKLVACEKGCGRELKPGPGKAAHERHCDGTAKAQGDAPKPRRQKRAKAAARPHKNGSALAGATGDMITALAARRDQIMAELVKDHPEVQDIDQAIAALEKVRGGGAP